LDAFARRPRARQTGRARAAGPACPPDRPAETARAALRAAGGRRWRAGWGSHRATCADRPAPPRALPSPCAPRGRAVSRRTSRELVPGPIEVFTPQLAPGRAQVFTSQLAPGRVRAIPENFRVVGGASR